MAEHGAAELAARPVVAGHVEVARKCAAVGGRAGQDVVPVGVESEPGDHGAALGQRGRRAEPDVCAVQVVDALRHHLALEILPRALADAVAGIHRSGAGSGIGAEIGAPGLVAGADGGGKLLAVPVGALDAAEIGALAGAGAGHEKRQVGRRLQLLLRLDGPTQSAGEQRCGREQRQTRRLRHRFLSHVRFLSSRIAPLERMPALFSIFRRGWNRSAAESWSPSAVASTAHSALEPARREKSTS